MPIYFLRFEGIGSVLTKRSKSKWIRGNTKLNLPNHFTYHSIFFCQDHVMSLTGKLSEEVAEGGDNFSTGQRQVKKKNK